MNKSFILPQIKLSLKEKLSLSHLHSECFSKTLIFWCLLWWKGASPVVQMVKNPPTCQYRRCRFDPWVGKIPWRNEWLSTSVFLPGESHGQESLAGYSPWGRKESDTTEQLSTQQERHSDWEVEMWVLFLELSLSRYVSRVLFVYKPRERSYVCILSWLSVLIDVSLLMSFQPADSLRC